MELKRHWLGQEWYLPGAGGNDINKVANVYTIEVRRIRNLMTIPQTNVPNSRLAWRHKTLMEELNMIQCKEMPPPPSF
jgi:AMP deaminase